MASDSNPQMLLARHNYTEWAKHVTMVLEIEELKFWIKSLGPKPRITATNFTAEKTATVSYDVFRFKQSHSHITGTLKTHCSPDIELEINVLDDLYKI